MILFILERAFQQIVHAKHVCVMLSTTSVNMILNNILNTIFNSTCKYYFNKIFLNENIFQLRFHQSEWVIKFIGLVGHQGPCKLCNHNL